MDSIDDIIARSLSEAAEEIENPPPPAEDSRSTFLITFDWAEGSTKGMVNALRAAGYHTIVDGRFPRTTIICRTRKGVADNAVCDVVEATLMDNGSAAVVRVGGTRVHVWPDKPWKKEQRKRWAGWNA